MDRVPASLAGLASPGGAAASFGGDDRFVSEYVESEFLAWISRRQRVFLTRTAVLERMCGPLCAAVLGQPGSAAALGALARSNMLLVPLDRRGQWYRYHHLFRDMLLAELELLEPGLIPVLRRRAATWYLGNDQPEEALEYFMAAGDAEAAAPLVEKLWLAADRQGRFATLQRWIRWLDDRNAIEGNPMLAVLAAFVCEAVGRPAEAERWADVADRWLENNENPPDDPAAEAWAALLRAAMCRRGAEEMRADADAAARKFAAQNLLRPAVPLLQGLARILCGDLDGGDAMLQDAVSTGEQVGAHENLTFALCQRSLVAIARRDWSPAGALAAQADAALRRAGIEESRATPLVCAVLARTAVHRRDAPAARQQLIRAQRLRHLLTYAIPHVAVQMRVQLIHVHLALGDLAGARALMQEADELLKRRPGLGTLVEEAAAVQAKLAKQRGSSVPGASALTAAELRLLPLLSTHLSVPEIAAELVLSPHTIKSQMKSIYRKLDASTRNQVVTRARDLELLEG